MANSGGLEGSVLSALIHCGTMSCDNDNLLTPSSRTNLQGHHTTHSIADSVLYPRLIVSYSEVQKRNVCAPKIAYIS